MDKPQTPHERSDRRPDRTRHWLQSALVELIQQHDYSTITVQQIVDQANTARITFYRHYKDKDELLLDYLKVVNEELRAYLPTLSLADISNAGATPPNLLLYRYIAEHAALYRVLLCGSVAGFVQRVVRRNMADYISGNLDRMLPVSVEALTKDLLANTIAGLSLSMITWWLDRDQPCSVEYLAEFTYQQNLSGLMGLISQLRAGQGPQDSKG